MDTLKYRWREWGMFAGGRLPWGHLHSTPLQLAFERGVPTLLLACEQLGRQFAPNGNKHLIRYWDKVTSR